MTTYQFTEEEKVYLSKTLKLVLEDLDAIREISPLNAIELGFEVGGEENPWVLSIDKDRINLIKNRYCFCKFEELIEKKKGFNKVSEYVHDTDVDSYTVLGQNMVLRFLAQYGEIRKKIIDEIKVKSDEKEDFMDSIRQLRTNFTSEVYVDFGDNQTQNVKELEVVEKDGKKIGTIDFGQKIVKIITEGDIVLTHTERAKEKLKTK